MERIGKELSGKVSGNLMGLDFLRSNFLELETFLFDFERDVLKLRLAYSKLESDGLSDPLNLLLALCVSDLEERVHDLSIWFSVTSEGRKFNLEGKEEKKEFD